MCTKTNKKKTAMYISQQSEVKTDLFKFPLSNKQQLFSKYSVVFFLGHVLRTVRVILVKMSTKTKVTMYRHLKKKEKSILSQ